MAESPLMDLHSRMKGGGGGKKRPSGPGDSPSAQKKKRKKEEEKMRKAMKKAKPSDPHRYAKLQQEMEDYMKDSYGLTTNRKHRLDNNSALKWLKQQSWTVLADQSGGSSHTQWRCYPTEDCDGDDYTMCGIKKNSKDPTVSIYELGFQLPSTGRVDEWMDFCKIPKKPRRSLRLSGSELAKPEPAEPEPAEPEPAGDDV